MYGIVVLVSVIAVVTDAADPCHGGVCESISIVDTAYHDLHLYYGEHLCKHLTHLDCTQYTATKDERVCGSDMYTYPDHCVFIKKRCVIWEELSHGVMHHELNVLHEGPCSSTTTMTHNPVTTTSSQTTHAPAVHPIVTSMPSTMPTSTPGMAPVSIVANNGMTTTAAGPVTTDAMTTTVAGSVTTDAVTTDAMTTSGAATAGSSQGNTVVTTPGMINGMIFSVFCQSASSIDCNTGFNIVCGSDGQYYPNNCELSKAKCVNPQLVEAVDVSQCAAR